MYFRSSVYEIHTQAGQKEKQRFLRKRKKYSFKLKRKKKGFEKGIKRAAEK